MSYATEKAAYENGLYKQGDEWAQRIRRVMKSRLNRETVDTTWEEDYKEDKDCKDITTNKTVSCKQTSPEWYYCKTFCFELYKVYVFDPQTKRPAWLYRENPPDVIMWAQVMTERYEKKYFDIYELDHKKLMTYIKENGFEKETVQLPETAEQQRKFKGVLETGLGLISIKALVNAGVAVRVFSNTDEFLKDHPEENW